MSSASTNRLHALDWLPGIEFFEADFGGRPFGRHCHDAFAIGAIAAGIGGYLCRGSRHSLPRRTLSLMNPGEMHTGYALSPRLRYRMLYATEESVATLLDEAHPRGFRELTADDRGGGIAHRLTEIRTCLDAPHDAGWKLGVETALSELLRHTLTRHAGLTHRPPGQESAAVRTVREYLDALAETPRDGNSADTSLCSLAERVQLHPNYLLQTFARQVGIPPYAYWQYRRIERAKALLLAGETAVDVAYRLGFHDQAHFLRSFRRITGATPGAFLVHRA
jgi:AraC-like DNA-binding protein